MLPTDMTKKPLGVADTLHSKDEKMETSHSSEGGSGEVLTRELTNHDKEGGSSNGDHVLVMQFMRNAIVDNPIIVRIIMIFICI